MGTIGGKALLTLNIRGGPSFVSPNFSMTTEGIVISDRIGNSSYTVPLNSILSHQDKDERSIVVRFTRRIDDKTGVSRFTPTTTHWSTRSAFETTKLSIRFANKVTKGKSMKELTELLRIRDLQGKCSDCSNFSGTEEEYKTHQENSPDCCDGHFYILGAPGWFNKRR